MTRTAFALLILLACASPASAQTKLDVPFSIAIGGLITASAADVATSAYRFGRGDGKEALLGAGLESHPIAFGVLKGSLTAATAFGLRSIHRTHPKVAFWLLVAGSSAEGLIAQHNLRGLP